MMSEEAKISFATKTWLWFYWAVARNFWLVVPHGVLVLLLVSCHAADPHDSSCRSPIRPGSITIAWMQTFAKKWQKRLQIQCRMFSTVHAELCRMRKDAKGCERMTGRWLHVTATHWQIVSSARSWLGKLWHNRVSVYMVWETPLSETLGETNGETWYQRTLLSPAAKYFD